jgi:phasin family protein
MFSISEQISAVAKTTLTNPMAVINALSKSTLVSLEKIIALNMNMVKQSLENSTTVRLELFSADKPQELFALSKVHAQPQIEKMVAYGRELADISTQTRHAFLASLTHSEEVITSVTKHETSMPVTSAPMPKLENKSPVKIEVASHMQLPLLVEAPAKVVKKTAPKTTKQPAASKTSLVTAPAEIKIATATAAKKPATSKPVEVAPVVKAALKPTTKLADTKPVATKPEITASVEKTPVAESPVEKKTAVKMPFPASPIKKPTFPTVSTRPAYKAKGSAATGAKKPVRQ